MSTKKKSAATFRDKAKKLVAEIAAKRDELRDLVEEYNSILEDVDWASDEFERSLETLSQQL